MTKQTFSTNAGQPTSEQIAQRAYEIWDKAGRPEGLSAEHWFQAETEIRGRTIISASVTPAPNASLEGARNARQTGSVSPRQRVTAARN